MCGDTECDIASCCLECGFLFCSACCQQLRTPGHGDDSERVFPQECPKCEKTLDFIDQQRTPIEACQKLERLIEEKCDDARLAHWHMQLGVYGLESAENVQQHEDARQHAMKCFKRAGKLGLGLGYFLLADSYIRKQSWKEAMRYYGMAAHRLDMSGIHKMGIHALYGYVDPRQPEEQKLDPDFEEAYRWFLAGAQLGHADCCINLAIFYARRDAIRQNLARVLNG